jgi:hypothetical protein
MKFIGLSFFLMLTLSISAQDIQMTRTGRITFHAGTSLEDIDASNNEVSSALNTKTGELVFNVLVKSFHFRRALMEVHFNENYMQSDKYPKAQFTGKVTNIGEVDLSKDGNYNVNAEGDLTIHGITKKLAFPATLTVKGGKLSASSKFKLKVEDFNITIPGVVADKISKDVEVNVDCIYEPR